MGNGAKFQIGDKIKVVGCPSENLNMSQYVSQRGIVTYLYNRPDGRVYTLDVDDETWLWDEDYLELVEEKTGVVWIDEDEVVDNVNHPAHYANKNIEVLDYIKDTVTDDGYEGYVVGNVIKYVSRYRLKGGIEDLKKAQFYLNDLIGTMEGGDD